MKLNLTTGKSENTEVAATVSVKGTILSVEFDVQTKALNVNPLLSPKSSQWGIWDWDVVEIFVLANPRSKTYYEFIVSPLNQYFELEIFEPRKRFNKEFHSGFKHETQFLTRCVNEVKWIATLEIPLEKLGWTGDTSDLRGGAFAILGESDNKGYWSAFLPKQQVADFHLPQYFQSLID